MKVYAVDKDRLGILLADKNVAHAIKEYNSDSETITIMLDKIAVQITLKEMSNLKWYGVKG